MQDFIPPKKTFEQPILDTQGKLIFTLKYEQATLREMYEFIALDEEEQSKLVLDEIRSQIPCSFIDKILKKIFKGHLTSIERNTDFTVIIKKYLLNKFRNNDSIYNDARLSKNSKNKYLVRNTLAHACQFWNLSLTELLDNYTVEQFGRLLDWYVFDMNSQSKEWQKINNFCLVDREKAREWAKTTREIMEKYNL